MLINRNRLLAGVATIAVAAFAGIAEAGAPKSHVLTVRLPDGQIEQVLYTGSAPPTLALAPAAEDQAFAMLAQMTAALDRQATAMLQDIFMVPEFAVPDLGAFPVMAGSVCMRSVEIAYTGGAQAPRVVTRTAGDCGPSNGRTAPAAMPVPARGPKVIQVRDARPYEGLVNRVSDLATSGRQ